MNDFQYNRMGNLNFSFSILAKFEQIDNYNNS